MLIKAFFGHDSNDNMLLLFLFFLFQMVISAAEEMQIVDSFSEINDGGF